MACWAMTMVLIKQVNCYSYTSSVRASQLLVISSVKASQLLVMT